MNSFPFSEGLAAGRFLGLASMRFGRHSLSLDAEKLLTGSGGSMPTTGILLLVVSTEDGDFSLPTVDEFIPAASDDLILASWDLNDGGGVAGCFLRPGFESQLRFGLR